MQRELVAMRQEMFVAAMAAIDEEDAVMLYRCSKLAESSPLFLEAVDMRRRSMEKTLAERFGQNLQHLQSIMGSVLGDLNRANVQAHREAVREARAASDEALKAARRAAEMNREHLQVRCRRSRRVCDYPTHARRVSAFAVGAFPREQLAAHLSRKGGSCGEEGRGEALGLLWHVLQVPFLFFRN
eukprot:3051872-Pleurochrysis_carterae.AAC.1